MPSSGNVKGLACRVRSLDGIWEGPPKTYLRKHRQEIYDLKDPNPYNDTLLPYTVQAPNHSL